jgi:hypothetical protein
MLGTAQEVVNFDIRNLTARRRVRLMPDEGQAGPGVAGKEPGVPVGAAGKSLSREGWRDGHRGATAGCDFPEPLPQSRLTAP